MPRNYTCLQARSFINTFFNSPKKQEAVDAMLRAMKHMRPGKEEDDCQNCVRYLNIEKKKRLYQIEPQPPEQKSKVVPIRKSK